MNAKKLPQLVFSAIMAVLFVKFYLDAKEKNIENSYGMVDVLAAARDIPPHTKITPDLVTIKQVPLKFVEPGAVLMKVPETDFKRAEGKVTIAATLEGSQIAQTNLNEPSMEKTGVSPLLPPGKVGFLLKLGNIDVAQLILPGDRINVLATFTVKEKGSDQNTRATYTILQNVRVVGVGKYLRNPNESVTEKQEMVEGLVLTLALEPKEAEKLSLAQIESQGEISVVVRAHGDTQIRQASGVTSSSLISGQ